MFKTVRGGFTLVEFLIVIGILSLSIGSILLLLTTVIKGTNQTNISAEVKQNGQTAFDAIEREIRGAKSVDQMSTGDLAYYGGSPSVNSGLIIEREGTSDYLFVICVNSYVHPTNSEQSLNGWIGIANGTSKSTPGSLSQYQPLTNRELVSGVDIICAYTSSQAFQANTIVGGSTRAVTIYFGAKQALNAPSRIDFNSEAQFKTTIALRDYN